MSETASAPANFIKHHIDKDLENGKNDGKVHTRFPPEPNGYLHIGHAKSICLNFGIAQQYQGSCNLRFDDTNPEKESDEYAKSIAEDVQWLGFEWQAPTHHASDYFETLHDYAVELIKAGKAYVDGLSPDDIREYRGTLTEAGKSSPFRDTSVEQNLDLFAKMRAGEFEDGKYILRAKIDMASPNMNLRDPALYRIKRQHHIRTGDTWVIYPMYDFTHPISDALEGITHSLCTLEFEDHRPLYDWILDNISIDCHPQQIEFSRLSLEYTITSKRLLNKLVTENHVSGWDDPRMPTIAGMRRRGYPPETLRDFTDRIGVTKKDNIIEMGVLENCVREHLNSHAPRAMAVLHPLKVTITNYPSGQEESLTAPCHPSNDEMGSRQLPFSKEIYIDQDDFRESANKKFKRLVLDKEVRLRNAYVIRCDEVIKDAEDNIIELKCSYDPDTLGKNPEGRKVKGVIHWVSASKGIKAEIRSYDRLFNTANPAASEDFLSTINPNSLTTIKTAIVEPSLATATAKDHFQFEREGYFCLDSKDATADLLIFNETVSLRDTWAKTGKA
ncbi:MAG: glutamine--tRNA ligase/YqeY domain fusion protein [Methylococcales bacterium]|jgi:glutaminyl-tRNA synthetase|nr:glutamine--tRNA ligase/YqeY domain fusion protein [Methylococcales bacterium]